MKLFAFIAFSLLVFNQLDAVKCYFCNGCNNPATDSGASLENCADYCTWIKFDKDATFERACKDWYSSGLPDNFPGNKCEYNKASKAKVCYCNKDGCLAEVLPGSGTPGKSSGDTGGKSSDGTVAENFGGNSGASQLLMSPLLVFVGLGVLRFVDLKF